MNKSEQDKPMVLQPLVGYCDTAGKPVECCADFGCECGVLCRLLM